MNYTLTQLTTTERIVNGINGKETRTETTPIHANTIYREGDICLVEDINGEAVSEQIFAVLPGLRAWKERSLRQMGAQRLELIAEPYSEQERTTWFLQREEAVKWVADNTALTPFCDAIAEARGIPREYFLPKVLENNQLFVAASAQILGQQQALIDRAYSEQDFQIFINLGWE